MALRLEPLNEPKKKLNLEPLDLEEIKPEEKPPSIDTSSLIRKTASNIADIYGIPPALRDIGIGLGSRKDVQQEVAKAVETPKRGMRGVAVGLEKAAENIPGEIASVVVPNVSRAIGIEPKLSNTKRGIEQGVVAAGEAVKPGYEPKTAGEKAASFIGETVGSTPAFMLATSFLPPLNFLGPGIVQRTAAAIPHGA